MSHADAPPSKPCSSPKYRKGRRMKALVAPIRMTLVWLLKQLAPALA